MIHITSIIHPEAEIDPSTQIGPWCHIGAGVRISPGSVLLNNVTILGNTTIGNDCHIGSYCVLGGIPQDPKYKFESTALVIGKSNRIHEFVTINLGTAAGGGMTTVGDNNVIMSYCHVGHDAKIASNLKIASYTGISGHAELHDFATVSGMVAISQRCRVGPYAYITGRTVVTEDIPPYCTAHGTNSAASIRGANVRGLVRSGFSRTDIIAVKHILNTWLESGLSAEDALSKLEREFSNEPLANSFISFIRKSRGRVLRSPRT